MSLSKRLAAIEKRMGQLPGTRTEADAKAFVDAILSLADRFFDEDARMDETERRIRLSAAQRLAWALRFGTPRQFNQAISDAVEMVA